MGGDGVCVCVCVGGGGRGKRDMAKNKAAFLQFPRLSGVLEEKIPEISTN